MKTFEYPVLHSRAGHEVLGHGVMNSLSMIWNYSTMDIILRNTSATC